MKPYLSGLKRVELWRSGFLNNKHSAIHLPGVEVSLLPALLPSVPPLLHSAWSGWLSLMASQSPGLRSSM